MDTVQIFFKTRSNPPKLCGPKLVDALINQHHLVDIDALYVQGATFYCSCNSLPPKMSLRRKGDAYHLVNDSKRGVHAVGCPLWKEAKVGSLSDIGLQHAEVAELILSAEPFRFASKGKKIPVYKDWQSVQSGLHALYPFLYGFLHFDGFSKPQGENWVHISITKNIKQIDDSASLGTGKAHVHGPWLSIKVKLGNVERFFSAPVLSFTKPLVLRHENERAFLQSLSSESEHKVESGYKSKWIEGKEVRGAAFTTSGEYVTVFIPQSPASEAIARRMRAWGLPQFKVEVINA